MLTYEVLMDISPVELAKKVNDKLNEGWQILGGVAISHINSNLPLDEGETKQIILYAQAVLKPR
jgi:hypothetical protein